MKLGTYYWDGWYAKISHWTERLLCDFTDREPVWGWEGSTIENMELQINYAADAGLAYFAFDWYYPEHGKISAMNDAVDRFLKASNCNRMEFCLLVANHGGGYIYRDKWEDACRMFMPYLKKENALKVDGKPVIIFFNDIYLAEKLGGEAECKKCMEIFQNMAKAEGLKGVYVINCVEPPRGEDGGIDMSEEAWRKVCSISEDSGVDAITGYNYHRRFISRNGEISYIFPYVEMAEEHRKSWEQFGTYGKLPYMPCVIGGWDCRPWEAWERQPNAKGPECYSPDITPTDLYNHVLEADQWNKANPDKSVDDLAIIYAWNENGEGGYIEPTFGDRGKKLEAVAKAIRAANAEKE